VKGELKKRRDFIKIVLGKLELDDRVFGIPALFLEYPWYKP
jgi:hypothetical protein